MQNLRFVEMRHRGLVHIAGAEAKSFLQALISNDMNTIDHDTGIYATLLTPQGKYLHDMFICEGGPGVVFCDHGTADQNDDQDGEPCETSGHSYLIEADRAQELAKRLNMYKLRAQVTIQPLDDWKVVGLFGSDLYDTLGLRRVAGDTREFGPEGQGGRRLTDPRDPAVGVRCYIPAEHVPEAFEALGAVAGKLVDFDQTRICKGLPDGCRDIEPEKSTLLENRFDDIGAISWTKGCYVGQEVTARMKYRNLGKKQLFVVDLEGNVPDKGTEISFGGTKVGEMRTSVPGIGLAILRLDAVDAYQIKGGDFVANGTHLFPRVEREDEDLMAVVG